MKWATKEQVYEALVALNELQAHCTPRGRRRVRPPQ